MIDRDANGMVSRREGLTMSRSPGDEVSLASLERKLQLVRDRTRGVVEGYATGFHLWGEDGIGKSFSVLGELERLRADFTLCNSHLTARGLFDTLEQFPPSVHVLEDCNAGRILPLVLYIIYPYNTTAHHAIWRVIASRFLAARRCVIALRFQAFDFFEERSVHERRVVSVPLLTYVDVVSLPQDIQPAG